MILIFKNSPSPNGQPAPPHKFLSLRCDTSKASLSLLGTHDTTSDTTYMYNCTSVTPTDSIEYTTDTKHITDAFEDSKGNVLFCELSL